MVVEVFYVFANPLGKVREVREALREQRLNQGRWGLCGFEVLAYATGSARGEGPLSG